MDQSLSGHRILDFGRYIAGPYCASLLAGLGAEVIRIENPGGGDDRYQQYPVTEDGTGATYLALNCNKLGLSLKPDSEGYREILYRLIQSADVVIANLPGNVMQKMGIDYDTLRNVRPDIILTGISAFGETGPYAGRVGLDGLAQAMSGSAYLSGQPDAPSKAYAPWADVLAGSYAAFGTLAALQHRQNTGNGQEVDTNLFLTGISGLSWMHTEQAATAINRQADGNRTQSSAPGDFFRTRDGWIVMQTIGQGLFKRWAELMGEDHWLKDERFTDDISRSHNRAVLCDRTQQWAEQLTNEEALEQLAQARIPSGPVLSPQQVLDDSHVRHNHWFTEVPYPGMPHPAKILVQPVSGSENVGPDTRRPPLPGEHTDSILRDLGFDESAIAGFRENGTI